MHKLGCFFHMDDVTRIQSILLNLNLGRDCLTWHFATNGIYTVKSGYWFAESLENSSSSDNLVRG